LNYRPLSNNLDYYCGPWRDFCQTIDLLDNYSHVGLL